MIDSMWYGPGTGVIQTSSVGNKGIGDLELQTIKSLEEENFKEPNRVAQNLTAECTGQVQKLPVARLSPAQRKAQSEAQGPPRDIEEGSVNAVQVVRFPESRWRDSSRLTLSAMKILICLRFEWLSQTKERTGAI